MTMKTFTLNFNEQQLQVLSAALVELPFKTSAPIIQHINAEIQKQFDKAVDAKDDEVVTTN
jgi:hypothetical protein